MWRRDADNRCSLSRVLTARAADAGRENPTFQVSCGRHLPREQASITSNLALTADREEVEEEEEGEEVPYRPCTEIKALREQSAAVRQQQAHGWSSKKKSCCPSACPPQAPATRPTREPRAHRGRHPDARATNYTFVTSLAPRQSAVRVTQSSCAPPTLPSTI